MQARAKIIDESLFLEIQSSLYRKDFFDFSKQTKWGGSGVHELRLQFFEIKTSISKLHAPLVGNDFIEIFKNRTEIGKKISKHETFVV